MNFGASRSRGLGRARTMSHGVGEDLVGHHHIAPADLLQRMILAAVEQSSGWSVSFVSCWVVRLNLSSPRPVKKTGRPTTMFYT